VPASIEATTFTAAVAHRPGEPWKGPAAVARPVASATEVDALRGGWRGRSDDFGNWQNRSRTSLGSGRPAASPRSRTTGRPDCSAGHGRHRPAGTGKHVPARSASRSRRAHPPPVNAGKSGRLHQPHRTGGQRLESLCGLSARRCGSEAVKQCAAAERQTGPTRHCCPS